MEGEKDGHFSWKCEVEKIGLEDGTDGMERAPVILDRCCVLGRHDEKLKDNQEGKRGRAEEGKSGTCRRDLEGAVGGRRGLLNFQVSHKSKIPPRRSL